MDLLEIRDKIDKVDREIIELYKERMQLCSDVADFKISTGKKVLDKERENQKIDTLTGLAETEFDKAGVRELFSQIMAISRKFQYRKLVAAGIAEEHGFRGISSIPKNAKVVYQGEQGAYAHEATVQYFGEEVDCYNVVSWRDAMEDIKNGKAAYGVFPIENSTAGSVDGVYDLLMEFDNYIVAETYIKVNHALLGVPGTDISDIKTVVSHPQALMQCENYLSSHREFSQISYSNTAAAAHKIATDADKTQAAIASKMAGKLYGLEVLAEDIVSSDKNTTRFIVVGSKKEFVEESHKISICFEIKHESGSLYYMLSNLIYNGLNMTNIESRPIPGRTWEYRFFVDVEGSLDDVAVQNAFTGMASEAGKFKILGNY